MSEIQIRIIQRLEQIFNFKKRDDWFREGVCPQCGKKEVFTHAINPRIVKCGRLNKCGYEEHVKDICEDLFKDWSKEFPKTEAKPHAAADAYLEHGRGFELTKLKGLYTQEAFHNEQKFPGQVSATVRFELSPGIYWERLIDRPERFGRQKANFKGKYEGLSWTMWQLDDLCHAESIWITEGIFNSIALTLSGVPSIATMSSGNYPVKLLQQITDRCHELKKDKPRLCWAYDNDKEGRKKLKKFNLRALQEKWSSTAALPPNQIKGRSFDWNDLYMHDLLHSEERKKYRHYGELLIAESAEQAGLLIYNFKEGRTRTFFFNHEFRLYYFNLDIDKYNKALDIIEKNENLNHLLDEQKREQALRDSASCTEICNRQIKPLYFQRNEITDEHWYYVQIVSDDTEVNTTFTSSMIRNSDKFAERLLGVNEGAWWTGSTNQLVNYMKPRTEFIKRVKTIDYIGYTKEDKAWLFNDYAVHDGQIIPINEHDYFRIKRLDIKTLSNDPQIQLNPKAKFNPTWWKDFYRVRGNKGIVALAWWMGTYFAEQIRGLNSSYPFMEIVGQAGAGKSRLIEFMWKLSGRKDYEGFDPNKSTSVAVYRNFAKISNLPVVLIEGDRNDINGNAVQKAKFSWDELKDAFNGRAIRSKGVKNAGNDTYEPPFRGAILISQNTQIQASEAILTRTLLLEFDRSGQSLETKRIVDELDRLDIEEACTFITHCLRNEKDILETYSKKLSEIEASYHHSGITHTRIALCHAQVASLVNALALHVLPIDLEEVCAAEDMLMDMASDRVDQLNGDHPDVEKFWDAYEYLQGNRSPEWGLNHHSADAHTIAINLNEVYKVAAKNYQQLPEINEMKKLLRNSRKYKFIESNKQVYSDKFPADDVSAISKAREEIGKPSRNVKCWIFTNPHIGVQK